MFDSPTDDVHMDGAVVVRCRPRFHLSAYIESDNILLANQLDGNHHVHPMVFDQNIGGS